MFSLLNFNTADMIAVHHRVIWPAIAAGTMLAPAIRFALGRLGVALGFDVAPRGGTMRPGAVGPIHALLTLPVAI